jgi:hypothetical protein
LQIEPLLEISNKFKVQVTNLNSRERLLQNACNHDVAANFSLLVFVPSALQTQAKACGYRNGGSF